MRSSRPARKRYRKSSLHFYDFDRPLDVWEYTIFYEILVAWWCLWGYYWVNSWFTEWCFPRVYHWARYRFCAIYCSVQKNRFLIKRMRILRWMILRWKFWWWLVRILRWRILRWRFKWQVVKYKI